MTNDDVLETIMAITWSAAAGNLLQNVDDLAAGLTAVGWEPRVDGGQWSIPDHSAWAVISADNAPNLAVFFTDDDVNTVYALGRELALRLDDQDDVHRQDLDPGWTSWTAEDPRWESRTALESEWATWAGGPALISLNVQPAFQPGRVRAAPLMHFQIERIDTPAEGLPDDDDRTRRIAHGGSPVARWHLAGSFALPDDVVAKLEHDDDPAVVAAVRASESLRRARGRVTPHDEN